MDSCGRTALAHACIGEKTDVIQRLAALPECDADIADVDGNTPLIYAVKSRKVHVCQILLDSFKGRVDVDAVNNKGKACSAK